MVAHKTADPSLKLSTPWIYELIHRDVQAGEDDWKTMLLRKYYTHRGARKGGGAAHLIPDLVDIDQRPANIETRETFGESVRNYVYDSTKPVGRLVFAQASPPTLGAIT